MKLLKKCYTCGLFKDLSEFTKKCTKKGDKERSNCKQCVSAYNKRYREANAYKIKKHKHQYYMQTRDMSKVKKPGRKSSSEYNRENNKKHIDEVAARAAVYSAIKQGILVKQNECEFCGQPNTVAHHPDYSNKLDVKWLCKKCHSLIHRKYDPICIGIREIDEIQKIMEDNNGY